jgi:hypothetical protein
MTFYVFENDGSAFTAVSDATADNYGGDGTVVMVEGADGRWTIECEQYYGRDGVCKLEITQPLERALRTFGALLAADALEEQRL